MFGGQGAARWARDGKLDLRRRIPLTRNFGIEVCGGRPLASVPLTTVLLDCLGPAVAAPC